MSATVLVVDDVPANLALLLDALGGVGYRVMVAETGESALETLEHGWPDAILLDYRLPGIDGLEVCRRIRAMPGSDDVPILFLTAVHELDEKVKALDAGAVDYVTKPIQPEEVLARLRTHLRVAQLQRSLAKALRTVESEMAMRAEAEGLLRDSLDRALLVVAQDGRIVFATRLAVTLLAKHFPPGPHERLPASFDSAAPPADLAVRRFGPSGSELSVIEMVATAQAGPSALLELGLTPREAEVLYWVAEGKTNAEVATILGSSRRTIEKHVEHLLEKLGVENRATAARVAAEKLLSGR